MERNFLTETGRKGKTDDHELLETDYFLSIPGGQTAAGSTVHRAESYGRTQPLTHTFASWKLDA